MRGAITRARALARFDIIRARALARFDNPGVNSVGRLATSV